jgi:hypothetical protein
MDLNEFQRLAKRSRNFRIQSDLNCPTSLSAEEKRALETAHHTELARLYLCNGLTAQIGEIANRLKKRLRDGADYDDGVRQEIKQQLGHALWYIAVLADEIQGDLGAIGEENIRFNNTRWFVPSDPDQPKPRDFDSDYSDDQRLPQRLIVEFRAWEENGLKKTRAFMFPNYPSRDPEKPFGDKIDDNSVIEDHYRFHDVYHFAYMAYLGWSPVVRRLLKIKRKVDKNGTPTPLVDRTQDGARASDTEEATTAFIYSYVSGQRFLETSDHVDTNLLMQVASLIRNLEVKVCELREWEEAIIVATRVLRDLVANNGGWIEVDRTKRLVRYLGTDAPTGSR